MKKTSKPAKPLLLSTELVRTLDNDKLRGVAGGLPCPNTRIIPSGD